MFCTGCNRFKPSHDGHFGYRSNPFSTYHLRREIYTQQDKDYRWGSLLPPCLFWLINIKAFVYDVSKHSAFVTNHYKLYHHGSSWAFALGNKPCHRFSMEFAMEWAMDNPEVAGSSENCWGRTIWGYRVILCPIR